MFFKNLDKAARIQVVNDVVSRNGIGCGRDCFADAVTVSVVANVNR